MRRDWTRLSVSDALFIAGYDLNAAAGLLGYNDLLKAAETWRLSRARRKNRRQSTAEGCPVRASGGRDSAR
ncbi:MAG: hypothetical protein AB1700_02070 [Bacillota bacterium]